MLINVVLCQLKIGGGISLAEKIHIFKRKPDFVCLPEYFLLPTESVDYLLYASRYDGNTKYLSRLSNELDTTLIAGTVIEKNGSSFYNTSYVYRRGEKLAAYRKRYPTDKEQEHGIVPGNKFIVFETDGLKVGVLICADVLRKEAFIKMGRLGADIIFIPTISPLLKDDSPFKKQVRDEMIFVAGARLANAFVVKTCGLGDIFGNPLNGRSLVAAPWGIIWQVSPENEQRPRIQSQILDIDELREFRRTRMIQDVVSNIEQS